MKHPKITFFWHRRDLRIDDNAGLFNALKSQQNVCPLFIFDEEILSKLTNKKDRRIQFIFDALIELKKSYNSMGSDIMIKIGKPIEVWNSLIKEHTIESVYTNRDYEPYALQRDQSIKLLLSKENIPYNDYKDQVIFETNEILKPDGTPYSIYTPFSKKWKEKAINPFYKKSYPVLKYKDNLSNSTKKFDFPTIEDLGFEKIESIYSKPFVDESIIENYEFTRDTPSIEGTSKLSVHLRFGTISIRELVKIAEKKSEKYLNELIWREFYMMILWHFPHIVDESYKKGYDRIEWVNNELDFEKWCNGKTGYPIVDAGMRQLNQTGWMHNRVRMIVASFLVKHLMIDWRWGEAYFAEHLNDYEQSSNIGGWQWCTGSGNDASPYFRIFNPTSQTQKFDPQFKYIKYWIKELDSLEYPLPIIEHSYARERCLKKYKQALEN